MTRFDELVPATPGRFDGIERPYSADDVLRLRGSIPIEHSLARRGALKLWELLQRNEPVRALGAADVLIADAGTDPEVLTLARRDVHRLDPDEVTPEALVALAQEGKQIAHLVVAPVDPVAIQALATASVAVEVLMAAPGT